MGSEIRERERLLRLSQFVLGAGARERRGKLFQGLVQVGILYNPGRRRVLSLDQIVEAVRWVCDLPSLPPEPVHEAVRDLVREGVLIESASDSGTFSLEETAKKQWEELVSGTFQVYDEAVDLVVERVREKAVGWSATDEVTVKRVFEEALVDIVASLGIPP